MSYILPTIGVSGTFVLTGTLQDKINEDEVYTCQGIRTIWDYESSNEDVKTKAYLDNGLTEEQYLADKELNMHILSLQGHMGMWIYVPASHVVKYPNHNGVLYQAKILTVGIPPIPVDKNLEDLTASIRASVISNLGVVPQVQVVEASRATMVDTDVHVQTVASRAAVMDGYITSDVTIGNLQRTVAGLREHVAQLESFIESLGL